MDMSKLSRLEKKISRSISPENYTGEKAGGARIAQTDGFAAEASRDLGTGWKCNPYIVIKPGETFVIKTNSNHIFASEANRLLEKIAQEWKTVDAVLGALAGQQVIKRETPANGIVRNTYSSGAVVIVNYTQTPWVNQGTLVPPRSALRIDQEVK